MPQQNRLAQSLRSAVPILRIDAQRDLPELMMPIGTGDTHSARVLHLTLAVCCLIAAGVIAWAALAQVSEAANLSGTLQPSARERRIAHADGGVVARVLVEEGDTVTAGQPLVEMEPTLAEAEMAFARARLAQLAREGRDLAALGETGPDTPGSRLRQSALTAEAASAQARARQQAATVATLRAQLETARNTRELALDDRDRARRLFAAEATSRSALNQREAAYNEARGRVTLLERQIVAAREGAQQGMADSTGLRARQALDLYSEGNQLQVQQAEAQALLAHAEQRLGRLIVRSPVSGTIKTLAIQDGDMVAPTGEVATLVPRDRLIVEARVLASERAGLRPGLDARLRIIGLDLPGQDWLDARVERISPSSFQAPSGLNFYTLRLTIPPVDRNREVLAQLTPGMEVTGAIVTGRKSVLAYILGPVRHGLNSALTEK
ncbi:MAG: HlyD family efflux transporter periplasmic adaptor subunit [Pseudomonadota bacterium]|nr:HlyD family efflux transporter periplasmic adaptor subunit [Pseudomonadota bacterium]